MRRPLKERDKNPRKPDHEHGSELVAMFTNYIMLDGKKSVAQKIVADMFMKIKEETKEDPLAVFQEAFDRLGPSMEVRSRRVGGANYQVPIEVRPERRLALAMRWVLDAVRSRKGAPVSALLAEELIAARGGEGEAMKKKENMHRMAEANKAFAHFAFVGKKKKKKLI